MKKEAYHTTHGNLLPIKALILKNNPMNKFDFYQKPRVAK